MKERTCLRRASDSDFSTFYGFPPPEGWAGFCADKSGEVIAFGWVWIDQIGRAWVGLDRFEQAPLLAAYRAMRIFFAAMQQAGIPALHALCDERIPTASRWLTRLGFAIDESLPKVYMQIVDKSLPVWKRDLRDGVEQ